LNDDNINGKSIQYEFAKVFLKYPEAHFVKIKSTNPLERLNKEIKRRTKSIGLFPSVKSINLLICCVLQHQAESWINVKSIYEMTNRNLHHNKRLYCKN